MQVERKKHIKFKLLTPEGKFMKILWLHKTKRPSVLAFSFSERKISCWDKCIPTYQVKKLKYNKNVREMSLDRKQQSRLFSGGTLTRCTFWDFGLPSLTHLGRAFSRSQHGWPWHLKVATRRNFSVASQDLWCQALCCEGQGRWNSCQPHTSAVTKSETSSKQREVVRLSV